MANNHLISMQRTGSVTLKLANNFALPYDSSSADDIRAAKRYQDFILGTMGNAIYLSEQYLSLLLKTTDLNPAALTSEQLSLLNATTEFSSFDPYTA